MILCDTSAEFHLNYKFIIVKVTMYSNCAITFSKQLWFIFKNIWNEMKMKWDIVCIGISTTLKSITPTPHPSFLSSPLKFPNCSSAPPPFQTILPSILVFCDTPLPPSHKSQIFQWTPKMLRLFILNSILSFKSN